ncbi:MAG: hypothetical protein HZC24_13015 [Rhodocyclales bacterium]|nr:hypothetical protein [Rhodocyclales bacterium]
MEIANTSISLESRHFAETRLQSGERLRAWAGPSGGEPATGGSPQAHSESTPPAVQISPAAYAAQSAEANAIDQAQNAADNDPMLALLMSMIEWITGKPVTIFDASALSPAGAPAPAPAGAETPAPAAQVDSPPAQLPADAGYGFEYDYHATRTEIEQMTFSAEGTVTTRDGQEIAFKLELEITRVYTEQIDISIRAGDAARKDPLVINFDGDAAQLSSQRFRFDIDSDGRQDSLPQLGGNSGFLVFDLNRNGSVDSGAELFGPATGSGFAELAHYDGDQNGWIDEKDPAFKQLLVWRPQGGGGLTTLDENDVAALYLSRIATPFELRGEGNRDLGAIRDSGLHLSTTGKAGSLQEIDLTA